MVVVFKERRNHKNDKVRIVSLRKKNGSKKTPFFFVSSKTSKQSSLFSVWEKKKKLAIMLVLFTFFLNWFILSKGRYLFFPF